MRVLDSINLGSHLQKWREQKIFGKLLKYLLISLTGLIGIIFTFILLTLYTNYEFKLADILKNRVEQRINNSIGGNSKIKNIQISKQDNKTIIITVDGLLSTNNKQIPILKAEHLIVNVDLAHILTKLSLFISTDKLFANIDEFQSPTKKPFEIVKSFDKLNKLITNSLKLGYIALDQININNLTIVKQQQKQKFKLNYGLNGKSHNLDITYTENNAAKLAIQANYENKSTNINGYINNFPLWVIATFIPEAASTDLVKHLDRQFFVNGKLEYNFAPEKKPIINFYLKKIKSPTNSAIQDFDLQISNHQDNFSLTIDKFFISIKGGGTFESTGKINAINSFINNKTSIIADIHINNVPVKYIGDFWPYKLEEDVRKWITTNFRGGIIHKATCKVNVQDTTKLTKDDLQAYVHFHDLEISYHEKFKSLTNLKGSANFDLDSVYISVDKGKLLSADIGPSYVQIDYAKKNVPITIKTNAQGEVKNFVHLMDEQTKQKLISKGIEPEGILGNLKTSVYIHFPIAKGFNFETAKMDVKADIDGMEAVLYDKIHLTKGDLNLVLNNKYFSLSGPIDINEQHSNFDWVSRINSKEDEFNTKFTINSYIQNNSNFEEIFNNKFRILDGHAMLNVVYYDYNKTENIQINMDLDNADYYIPPLGISKAQQNVSTLSVDLHKKGAGNWYSKTLSLKAQDNINIGGYLEASPDFNEINILNIDFLYPESNFKVDFKQDDKIKHLKISGEKINLSDAHISELFANNQFVTPTNQPAISHNKELILDIGIDRALMNNGMVFSNINGNFDCIKLHCTKSNLTADIGKNSKVRVQREESPNNNVQWVLHASNASELLKGLGMYQDLVGGDLKITVWNAPSGKILLNPQSVFVGQIHMSNFQAIKNPIVTKLVSFTSITGILNIFTNMDKIPFDNLDGHFVFANDVLRLNRVNASGHYLTLTMNGTVDWNYNNVDLYGKVVPPVYGFNYLLALLPFVGHKTTDGKSRGLIAANYSITGKIGHTHTFINPLAIILPDIFDFLLA